MKLSEAMRLGAMLGPQVFGYMFGDGNSACALGGAILAAGCPIVHGGDLPPVNVPRAGDTAGLTLVPNAWIPVLQTMHSCPVCDATYKGYRLIAHLNDSHRWTREAIADFIETRERSLEDAAVGRHDKRVASKPKLPVSA